MSWEFLAIALVICGVIRSTLVANTVPKPQTPVGAEVHRELHSSLFLLLGNDTRTVLSTLSGPKAWAQFGLCGFLWFRVSAIGLRIGFRI